ncbi:adenylosuccinate synthetase, putative [Theileria equi strain WA]|uniref:Adenylosuccinate synthetase n=1 Tax=Theileria equi strain WA TaxID=1537102 RepID=L0B0C8_THEEQ|nr:adenylosuccinate synthetase, putative [Theileria equi strain WA]AFZ80721.1 adenylosuccinate synthetase, putative [Theileria equi strain WA]|eukprot:XP_004830387.1 adenylosuccinate synthetase, putative [Theileria equi strain WA]
MPKSSDYTLVFLTPMVKKDVYDKSTHKVLLVSGMQWGDEGKGKVVSDLSKEADVLARYNGGHNSGHDVVLNGVQYKLHLLPCGSMHENTKIVLGNGVVINIENLLKEVDILAQNGISLLDRLYISERAHLIFNIHAEIDCKQESDLSKKYGEIGTTKKGIGPSYSTKSLRTGIMIGEMLHWETFSELVHRLMHSCTTNNPDQLAEKELARHKEMFKKIEHCIVDTSFLITKAVENGQKVFFEGANGVLLDLSLGTYPYVTSSNTTTSGIYNGLGISPSIPVFRIGVLKAYQTRIGSGPFPTELFGEVYDKLQTTGMEVGVTSGRKRRCGWLDLVSVRYAQLTNGFNVINLTKLDIMSIFDTIKVCVDYKHSKTGAILPRGSFPATSFQFSQYEPVYKEFPGWRTDLSEITKFEDLPAEAKAYVEFIENDLGVWIQWIGVGKDTKKTIVRT